MKLLHATDINGRLPWELASDFGHDELASYLFCRTARCEIARLSTMSVQGLSRAQRFDQGRMLAVMLLEAESETLRVDRL